MRNHPHRLPRLWPLLLVLCFLSEPAQAAGLEAKGTSRRKFQRGVMNMALAPLEITHALAQEKKENKALIPSWLVGLGRGSWFALLRAFTGIYEVVTFPIPIPPRYEPIMLPEFPLEPLGLLKDES